MKKVITLLLLVGTVASASAQTAEESRRVVLGTGGDSRTERNSPIDVILGRDRRVEDDRNTRYPSGTYGSREREIDQVNREYDRKIYSIRNNRTLTASEKERMIRQLENDRARRIRGINNRYYGDRRDDRRYDDDYSHSKNKKYKKDNGNHYGWERGVGNPHRSGSNKSNGKGKGRGRN
jgi:hypothetical protein